MSYPGPSCKAVGLTRSVLLAATSKKPKKLPKLDIVSNELVIELETFCKNATNGCSDVLKTWVLGLSGAVSVPQPTAAAFRYAVKKAIHQRQQLLKSKSHAPILRKFLQQPFQMPGATIVAAVMCIFPQVTLKSPVLLIC